MRKTDIKPAPDIVEYECPSCGYQDSVYRRAKWKIIKCRECRTVILNEDIDRL